MVEVVYLKRQEFGTALQRLKQRGGQNQRAHDEACKVIEDLRHGIDVSNKITNNGETRIAHCLKYNLSNDAHRLVTVHTQNFIYLLFVGTHEETEKWIEANKGLTITANKDRREVRVTHVTRTEILPSRPMPEQAPENFTLQNLPFLKRLENFDLAEFVPSAENRYRLLSLNEFSDDDEFHGAIEPLTVDNHEIANLLFDILCELRDGKIEAAKARLDAYRGTAVPVTADTSLEASAVKDRANSDELVILTGLSEIELKRLLEPDRFHEWMLFLHPEQKRIADADYDRPTVLTGVSGSGKTCVLVHRARHLARKYPNQRIGILTLNRSLSRMLQNLVNELCTESERSNIVVQAFYDYFKELVEFFGPTIYLDQLHELAKGHRDEIAIQRSLQLAKKRFIADRTKFAREIDPIGKECIRDAWELFLDQPHVRTLFAYFEDHLHKYQSYTNSERYLQEELSLVRSALPSTNRLNGYLEMEREGRAIPFPAEARKINHEMLQLWEETMLSGGLLDELSLTAALLPSRPKLKELPEKMRFRCLLIDEFQDLSTLDLALLRLIPTDAMNGLFVAGDPVQRVMVKSLKMASVGLDITTSRREKITKNYRNSRQILLAASQLANRYGEMARKQREDIEILDPELAVRETAQPIALKVSVGEEVAKAWNLVRDCLNANAAVPWSINIATASPDLVGVEKIIQAAPSNLGVSVKQITGDFIRNKDSVTVGTISDVKGFEFSMIVIIGCGKKFLPDPNSCHEESWRDALRLYVAMTRGRDSVYLIYSDEPSEFLETMRNFLTWE